VIVVAHRPNLLANLDRIAVIADGAVKALGPSSIILSGGGVTPLHAPRKASMNAGAAA
jgi:ABC-type protease/lipase transport system fused ATPase/permease subunit